MRLIELDCGDGIYKRSSELPDPRMDRSGGGLMDKKTLSVILNSYSKTKQYNKIREIHKATRFGVSYNNIGTKKINFVGLSTVIFFMYFLLMSSLGLRR